MTCVFLDCARSTVLVVGVVQALFGVRKYPSDHGAYGDYHDLAYRLQFSYRE
jgi:hypothetical protein